MAETYYVGAYWGPRRESAGECARRTEVLVRALSQVDPLFARWFKQAKSRKQALQRPLETEAAGLEDYLQRNVPRDDTRKPIEDMGFSVWLWNGGSGEEEVGLNFNCGGSWERANNRCLLSPPSAGPAAERVLTVPVLSAVMRALVTAWDPDWAVATSSSHREAISAEGRTGTFVGWLTYHSRRRGMLPPLPAPTRAEPVENQGTLLVLTSERLTAAHPEHVALTRRVMDLLEPVGLLKPVLPPLV